jgi:hypothetical protein
MKDNNNPDQVVIARELYDELTRYADSFAYMQKEGALTVVEGNATLKRVSRIKWHARKFNKQLRVERKVNLALELDRVRQSKKALFALLTVCTGKQVWLQVHPIPTGETVYIPVTLLGRGVRYKEFALIKMKGGEKVEKPIHMLLPELPEGFHYHTLGRYHGLAIKQPLFSGAVGELK